MKLTFALTELIFSYPASLDMLKGTTRIQAKAC